MVGVGVGEDENVGLVPSVVEGEEEGSMVGLGDKSAAWAFWITVLIIAWGDIVASGDGVGPSAVGLARGSLEALGVKVGDGDGVGVVSGCSPTSCHWPFTFS